MFQLSDTWRPGSSFVIVTTRTAPSNQTYVSSVTTSSGNKGMLKSFLETVDSQQRDLGNLINNLYHKTGEFLHHADKGWLIPSTFHLGIFQIPLKPLLTSVGLDEHKLDKFLSDPKDVNEHKRVMYLLQRSLKPKHDQIPEAKTHPPQPASRTSHHKRPASQASTVFELDVSSTIPEREEGPHYPSIKAN